MVPSLPRHRCAFCRRRRVVAEANVRHENGWANNLVMKSILGPCLCNAKSELACECNFAAVTA